MRRATRRRKPVDTRQLDLFASAALRPVASNDADAQKSERPPIKASYEAQVIGAMVNLLNRQWYEQIAADGAARTRFYRQPDQT